MSIDNRFLVWHIVGLLIAASVLAGCSGAFSYPNNLTKNLHVRTQTSSDSFFSSVRAAVGIYRVDERCEIEYQGTVDLDEASVSVGIPTGDPSYLVFEFANNSFLANSRRRITYETLLKPVAGYDYHVEVSYVDDIYNVEIRETRPGASASHEIEKRELNTCRA